MSKPDDAKKPNPNDDLEKLREELKLDPSRSYEMKKLVRRRAEES